jgi:protocatechuate 3,4-dioxygenase beta subunit
MLRKTLAACILTASALAAQVVEGRVVNTANGNGVPDASVGLVAMGQTAYRASTDATGRFRIEGVKDGAYTAFCTAAKFRSAHDGASRTYRVAAGAELVRLEYKMVPLSKISGRVLDDAGNPVPKARLQIMDVTQSSSIGTSIVNWAANEKGEYVSPEAMLPGTWTVSATVPPAWNSPEPRDGQRLGWARTFYPSVTDPELAVKLEVPPGAEFSNLDIKLATAPVYRIRGVLLDVHGDPVPKASVELGMARGGGILTYPGRPRQDTDADGAFEFASVVDGEFRLSSTVNQDGVKQWTSESIEVKGRDVENFKLQLTLPFSIEEKIVMEVPEGAATPTLPIVTMMAAAPGAGNPSRVPDGKGGFTVENLYPGFYQVHLTMTPPLYYLDSIRLGGMDVPPAGVQILSGVQRLVLTYKRNGGTVRGTVEHCSDGVVFLVPQDPALRRFGFIRQTNCDKNGRFEIADVRPGEYYGFAVAQDSRVAASPMSLDQSLINQSARLSVRSNEVTDAEVRLVMR